MVLRCTISSGSGVEETVAWDVALGAGVGVSAAGGVGAGGVVDGGSGVAGGGVGVAAGATAGGSAG